MRCRCDNSRDTWHLERERTRALHAISKAIAVLMQRWNGRDA